MLGFTQPFFHLLDFWVKTKGGSQVGFYAIGPLQRLVFPSKLACKRKAEFDTAVSGEALLGGRGGRACRPSEF